MARFHGMIGYAQTVETSPGIHKEMYIEKPYTGDVIKSARRYDNGPSINDDLVISNSISIVADAYAYLNVHAMRYVKWMGSLWKITNVDIERPRLILSIGGVFNA